MSYKSKTFTCTPFTCICCISSVKTPGINEKDLQNKVPIPKKKGGAGGRGDVTNITLGL